MNLPAALIAAFPPSAELLLETARRNIDDKMLKQIADADYGIKSKEMLAELRPIRDRAVIPTELPFQLWEVLSLSRWHNPDSPNKPPFKPGPTGRSGHQIRLFACAVLLRATAAPASRGDHADDATLAQCLVSAKVLGNEFGAALARFLTWRIPQLEISSESLLFAVGLLALSLRLRAGRLAESEIKSVAEWVIAEESHYRTEFHWDPANPEPAPFSRTSGFWDPLVKEMLEETATISSVELRNDLQLCALLLDRGS